MRAARVVAPGRVTVEDVPVPPCGDAMVLVRTELASICGSDLHRIFDEDTGKFPTTPGHPGHEAVGHVVESRSASFAVGDLVLAVPDPHHSTCFAEFQALEERYALRLSPDADRMAALMAQQLGTVIFALERIWPGAPAGLVTVIGAGSAGLHFVTLLKQRGFDEVVVADLTPARLRMARKLGADVAVQADTQSVVEATMKRTGGHGAALVIEAAGHDVTRAQAMAAVRERGRIGLFGLPEQPGDAAYPFDVLFRRQPTIEIAHGAQHETDLASFRAAVREIENGRVAGAEMVSHVRDIEEIGEAVRLARERHDGALKVCVSFGK